MSDVNDAREKAGEKFEEGMTEFMVCTNRSAMSDFLAWCFGLSLADVRKYKHPYGCLYAWVNETEDGKKWERETIDYILDNDSRANEPEGPEGMEDR